MLFSGKKAGVQWLVVGLGNPGAKYEGTRHNMGFLALDAMAQKWGVELNKVKFQALTGLTDLAGQRVLLMKPQTFMNLSGHSVGEAAHFYKVEPSHVLVLCDDVAQPPAQLRIRSGGSAGGHNGLKDIITALGSQDFVRLRIGVGAKPNPEYDLADWVLGRLPAAEMEAVRARYDELAAAVELIVQGRLGDAQSRYNH